MKLQHLDEIALPFIENDPEIIKEIDEAYQEIALLHKAMETGNFGYLIGKTGILNHRDIYKIRAKIKSIVTDNILFDGSNANGRDGREKLRAIAHQFGHGFEMVAMTALGAALGVGLAALGPAGMVAGAGAVVGIGALQGKQVKSFAHLKSAAKLLDIVDTRSKLNPGYRPSAARRFFNWLSGKKDHQVRREAEVKIKAAAREADKRFKKAVKGLPETIEFVDSRGDIAEMSVYDLFADI